MGNHSGHLVLPFDDVVMEMSPQMAETWKHTHSMVRDALSLKVAPESVQAFERIPCKAQNNNHREDWKNRLDKEDKAWQQSLLHISRLLAYIGTTLESSAPDGQEENMQDKFLCVFHMVGDLKKKIESHRKESSIIYLLSYMQSLGSPHQPDTRECPR